MTDSDWLEERRGFITASRLADVCAKPTTARYQDYAFELACEREGALMDAGESPHRSMRFGKAWEERAVRIYEGAHLEDIVEYYGTEKPKFVKWIDHHSIKKMQSLGMEQYIDGLKWFGSSPDGDVNKNGNIEVKLAMSVEVQGQRLSMGRPEKKHIYQTQGILLANGRSWIDFISFCPSIQPVEDQWFEFRYYRDERFIANLIVSISAFNTYVEELRPKAAAA
ncbi:MAG: YqaJ viral recombinase family protein [Planctomycetota bacterium]